MELSADRFDFLRTLACFSIAAFASSRETTVASRIGSPGQAHCCAEFFLVEDASQIQQYTHHDQELHTQVVIEYRYQDMCL